MHNPPDPQRIALVGCGAIAELYYAPALKEVCRFSNLEVTALCDPSVSRLNNLRQTFPSAQTFTDFDQLLATKPNLAIVASPPQFHASQTCQLLTIGTHVLCEKPMANTVAEAESMIIAAKDSSCVLAIGLFRRFFPALQTIRAIIGAGTLGRTKSFNFSEGGQFNWPAASGSFFQKKHSNGGVFLDLGVHVLDLVCWWFGKPSCFNYQDDAMGNLEANSHLSLTFEEGLTGLVRLSRDTKLVNQYLIEFERGSVTWSVGDSNHLDLRLDGLPFEFRSDLYQLNSPAPTYHHSFVNQLLNFVAAARGKEALVVSGDEGLRSLELIEACYRSRNLLPMPWLGESELSMARELTVG